MEHRLPDPETFDSVIHNPSWERMRRFSRDMEQTTEFDSPAYVTDYRSRSADRTKNALDHDFSKQDVEQIKRAQEYARTHELVCVDRRMGRHPDHSYVCRYYVPKRFARIALGWSGLLEPVEGAVEPDFHTVQLPTWSTTMIRVFPDDGVTYVLGSDYTGEAKMSFLRLFLYHAKQSGGLGLHAGSKRVRLRTGDGMRDVGQLFLGLSATGKTTLTGHGLWLEEPEEAELLQDDICALTPDGAAAGSEGGGLYIKTYGLTAEEQPELYHAVTQPHTVLENVAVAEHGDVDFFDDSLTRNGRAVIRRADLEDAADDIDLEEVDQVFFITRNPLMPPLAKLTHEQAAAAFMLGESIQTSAGDPDKAGEAIRVVGTNPFIIGSKGAEGNRFLELVEQHDIECYLMNTGHLDEDTPIEVEHSVQLLEDVARGQVGWDHDDILDLQLPTDAPGFDTDRFYPPDHFDDYEQRLAETRQDRRSHLQQFDDLAQRVRDAVY